MTAVTHTTPYRPSNASEGDSFYNATCLHCRHGGPDFGCNIYMDAMVFDIDDPEYPMEWISEWSQGRYLGARCTAFQDERYPDATPRCPLTIDLFEAAP